MTGASEVLPPHTQLIKHGLLAVIPSACPPCSAQHHCLDHSLSSCISFLTTLPAPAEAPLPPPGWCLCRSVQLSLAETLQGLPTDLDKPQVL